ncbi:carbon-nitrogen hydrolase family protein [Rhodohalobacter sp. 8-1]|uniref:carbon-nitrogen hydrolase family protein n=1 Tax=Rhodohalobacter sp. 8-1 TaxID=3131972 RepID=UPI0030EBAE29
MKTYKAAVVQMNSQPDVALNLKEARRWIRAAADEGTELVGLPEYFSFLGHLSQRKKRADKISRRSYNFLKETAAEFNIYLLGGTIPVPADDGRTYNRSLLFNPAGDVVAKYDKIHLFDVELSDSEQYRESDDIKPGENKPVTYTTDSLGTLGLSVCYDLRFPELYRALIDQHADLITVPSAFTATTGKDHWEPLLQARAIENTAYVFAPAQTGTHGETRKTHGNAMIIDPWGDIIAHAGTDPGIAIATIDPARMKQVRNKIPSLLHRVL